MYRLPPQTCSPDASRDRPPAVTPPGKVEVSEIARIRSVRNQRREEYERRCRAAGQRLWMELLCRATGQPLNKTRKQWKRNLLGCDYRPYYKYCIENGKEFKIVRPNKERAEDDIITLLGERDAMHLYEDPLPNLADEKSNAAKARRARIKRKCNDMDDDRRKKRLKDQNEYERERYHRAGDSHKKRPLDANSPSVTKEEEEDERCPNCKRLIGLCVFPGKYHAGFVSPEHCLGAKDGRCRDQKPPKKRLFRISSNVPSGGGVPDIVATAEVANASYLSADTATSLRHRVEYHARDMPTNPFNPSGVYASLTPEEELIVSRSQYIGYEFELRAACNEAGIPYSPPTLSNSGRREDEERCKEMEQRLCQKGVTAFEQVKSRRRAVPDRVLLYVKDRQPDGWFSRHSYGTQDYMRHMFFAHLESANKSLVLDELLKCRVMINDKDVISLADSSSVSATLISKGRLCIKHEFLIRHGEGPWEWHEEFYVTVLCSLGEGANNLDPNLQSEVSPFDYRQLCSGATFEFVSIEFREMSMDWRDDLHFIAWKAICERREGRHMTEEELRLIQKERSVYRDPKYIDRYVKLHDPFREGDLELQIAESEYEYDIQYGLGLGTLYLWTKGRVGGLEPLELRSFPDKCKKFFHYTDFARAGEVGHENFYRHELYRWRFKKY